MSAAAGFLLEIFVDTTFFIDILQVFEQFSQLNLHGNSLSFYLPLLNVISSLIAVNIFFLRTLIQHGCFKTFFKFPLVLHGILFAVHRCIEALSA